VSRRIVIVGGGFGGLQLAHGLRGDVLDVTLVDRQNFFLFQPLAYQVATGSLSSVEVAIPLRQALRRQHNTRVVLGEVTGFDLDARTVHVNDLPTGGELDLPYDVLAVAGGSRYSYFGHDDWAHAAPELKSLDGALDLRDRILLAFESAEVEPDTERRAAWLTFVIVGAGPTGVEMAGQIAELARDVLPGEYRGVDTRKARVLLVEAGPHVLGAFSERLSRSAETQLRSLGVTPMLETTVVGIDDGGVEVVHAGERQRIAARTKVWAAGVAASPLGETLTVGRDRAGHVPVTRDLTIAAHPEVFVVGDLAAVPDGPLPAIAPAAKQMGRYAARAILAKLSGRRIGPFRYRHLGSLATIGRMAAVADFGRIRLSGPLAWWVWLTAHIYFLIGFRNRLVVLIDWAEAYLSYRRGARIIIPAGEPAKR
jgi:NADH dehydrogenase